MGACTGLRYHAAVTRKLKREMGTSTMFAARFMKFSHPAILASQSRVLETITEYLYAKIHLLLLRFVKSRGFHQAAVHVLAALSHTQTTGTGLEVHGRH